jgi:hypothetical protein
MHMGLTVMPRGDRRFLKTDQFAPTADGYAVSSSGGRAFGPSG